MLKLLKTLIFTLFKPKSHFRYFWEKAKIHYLNWFQNPQNISIWEYSYIWPLNRFFPWTYNITLWKWSRVAFDVVFLASSHAFNEQDIASIPYDYRYVWWDIVVWDWAWIWARCTILPGVTIWKGAVIWAWSVVTKNVPDFEVRWWCPAKKISMRKNIERFEELLLKESYIWK